MAGTDASGTDEQAGTGPDGTGEWSAVTRLAEVAGRTVCLEMVGEPGGPVLVLINGLAGQLIDWEPRLLAGLRAAGFTTLRFDNRDVGRSSGADDRYGFDLDAVARRDRSALAYTLEDLADDVVALLDRLGVDRAHVLGVSMGGMIAQLVAVRHPGRVRSLCSIMSTTGARDVGQPTEEAVSVLMTPAPDDRTANVDHQVAGARVIGSPGFPFDEARQRAKAAAKFDRAFRPRGVARQLMAILLADDRTAALAGVRVPTLVVHGEGDPLVTVSGGRATAAAVPGATLLTVPGMGHEIPPEVAPQVAAEVAANAAGADGRVRAPGTDGPLGGPRAAGQAQAPRADPGAN